jgi:hypothetical protein
MSNGLGEARMQGNQAKQWWQRDDWTQIATVAAVLVGAGTLLLTAIATFFQARVAQDQLDQSRRTSDNDARGQAVLVSHWTGDGESSLHVMNRSLDPVNEVSLAFHARTALGKNQQPPRGMVTFVIKLGSLPPCSTIAFSEKTVGFRWKRADPNELTVQHPVLPGLPREEGTWRGLKSLRRLEMLSLFFTDRDGAQWSRDKDGRLGDQRDGIGYPVDGPAASPGRIVRAPQIKPLDTCREG